MKKYLLAAMAFALTSAACDAPAPQTAALSDEDVTAIRAVNDAWIQAALDNDYAALEALYSDDAVMMPPNEPAVEGRAAIRAMRESYADSYEVTVVEYFDSIIEIDGRDGLAYMRGTGWAKVRFEEDGAIVEFRGKSLAILRKQADGSWLITHDISNYDVPPPEEVAKAET